MTTIEAPTPQNPAVYRLGKVERRFRAHAAEADVTPGDLLVSLLDQGVTQTELANLLGCTRQAVGILASRYGLGFPGAKLDLDTAAQEASNCQDFQHYVQEFWVSGALTQKEISKQLGASLSTIKRRIKALNIK